MTVINSKKEMFSITGERIEVENLVWYNTFQDVDKAKEHIYSYIREDIEDDIRSFEEPEILANISHQKYLCRLSYGDIIEEISI